MPLHVTAGISHCRVVVLRGSLTGRWSQPSACPYCGTLKPPHCSPSACYTNYRRFTSVDEGRTWRGPFEIPNAGTCRPRLRMLGNGKGPLLLSGGHSVNRGRWDISLWVNADGMGEDWVEHSVSYAHNRLQPDPALRFSAGVNTTEDSYAYTSLLAVDARTVVLTYDMRGPAVAAFAMRVSFGGNTSDPS